MTEMTTIEVTNSYYRLLEINLSVEKWKGFCLDAQGSLHYDKSTIAGKSTLFLDSLLEKFNQLHDS